MHCTIFFVLFLERVTYLHAFECKSLTKICDCFCLIAICQCYRELKLGYPSHPANIKFHWIFKRNVQFFWISNWIHRHINNIYRNDRVWRVRLWIFDWFKWRVFGCIIIIGSKATWIKRKNTTLLYFFFKKTWNLLPIWSDVRYIKR